MRNFFASLLAYFKTQNSFFAPCEIIGPATFSPSASTAVLVSFFDRQLAHCGSWMVALFFSSFRILSTIGWGLESIFGDLLFTRVTFFSKLSHTVLSNVYALQFSKRCQGWPCDSVSPSSHLLISWGGNSQGPRLPMQPYATFLCRQLIWLLRSCGAENDFLSREGGAALAMKETQKAIARGTLPAWGQRCIRALVVSMRSLRQLPCISPFPSLSSLSLFLRPVIFDAREH